MSSIERFATMIPTMSRRNAALCATVVRAKLLKTTDRSEQAVLEAALAALNERAA